MNQTEYLSRIGINEYAIEPNEKTLRLLQRQHLLTVPFENLDIHWKRPIILDTDRFYKKIVVENRGGFCYELNGLFNELLHEIGFDSRLVSARVSNGSGHGHEFDHAAIIVTVSGEEYLSDVGFGTFTAEPLRFILNIEQRDDAGIFIIRRFDENYFEVAIKDGDAWKSEYIFKDVVRKLSEFSEMCDFQQYSPDSHFTKGKLCSIMTENGRKTLTDKSFIVTTEGKKTESAIESEEQFDKLLITEFGIESKHLSKTN